MPIDGEYDPTREAFDHYLPKSKYPFNSVNLKNLAPSCNKCNSSIKRDQDPLHDRDNKRRKAFFPFSSSLPNIQVSISIKEKRWNNLTPDIISIDLDSESYKDEVATWKELFRIDERYAAKCCSKNGGLGWLNRVLSEHENYNLTNKEMLEAEISSASTAPWRDNNFLKKAFLEECRRIGLVA